MSLRILLVEDEPGLVLTLSDLLSAEGYEVETAMDGPTGLAKATSERFDLIILDVIMPEMDGFEVCRKIRQIHSYAETPIIMLTAKSGEEDKQRGVEVGASLYLPKPISPKRLITLVEEAMG